MNRVVVYLEWPESCFRASSGDLAFLRTLVGKGTEVVRVRSDRAFLRELKTATQAITWHFREDWYAAAPRLKAVATPAAGRELVSTAAPPGVAVHFGHFQGAIMAESVTAFLLAWSRGFFAVRDYAGFGGNRPSAVRNWPRAELASRCRTLAGTRACVVGCGNVGGAIRRQLEALGVAVRGFTRKNISGLPTALRETDWLILALPSDTGTDNFLSRSLLRRLPRRAVVANVGRGNAIDEDALVDALRAGRLAGAYLDVFKDEPGPIQRLVAGRSPGILAADPADLPPTLVRMPHASAFSGDYVKRCFRELKDDGIL